MSQNHLNAAAVREQLQKVLEDKLTEVYDVEEAIVERKRHVAPERVTVRHRIKGEDYGVQIIASANPGFVELTFMEPHEDGVRDQTIRLHGKSVDLLADALSHLKVIIPLVLLGAPHELLNH